MLTECPLISVQVCRSGPALADRATTYQAASESEAQHHGFTIISDTLVFSESAKSAAV